MTDPTVMMLVIEVVLVTPSSKVTLYITGPHTLLTSALTVHDIVAAKTVYTEVFNSDYGRSG